MACTETTCVEQDSCSTSAIRNTNVAINEGDAQQPCIYCNSVRKWRKSTRGFEKLSAIDEDTTIEKIAEEARQLKDEGLLAKLSAAQVKYHHTCRNAFSMKCKRKCDTKETTGDLAYEKLRQYVQNKIICNHGAEKLTTLYQRYVDEMNEHEGKFMYKPQYLCDKLLDEYPAQLTVYKTSNKEGVVVSHASLDKETALNRAAFAGNIVKEAARYLRTLILEESAKVNELASPLTDEVLRKGQTATPPELEDFFNVLYGSSESKENEKVRRLVTSSCDDVVFNTTRGRVKPGKHVCLGLGIKSLTGSRKIVEVLNRFGHSINYHLVESFETQIASEISSKNCSTPDGILKQQGLCTALAWDNYDENSETLSGTGTLHDTVGICYQNVTSEPTQQRETDDEDHQEQQSNVATDYHDLNEVLKVTSRSKRSLTIDGYDLIPYRKKPKMAAFQYRIKESDRPECNRIVERRDTLWAATFMLSDRVPMWAGWNSLLVDDLLPKQTVAYMKNINLPPTRLDVVAETMRVTQMVAKECGENSIAVTYDLAIAKPALQIQEAESPAFDNLFICFGPFHIILAYFGSLGYFLDGSGGPDILTDSGVLAHGSLNGFLKGKHYNRCHRLHQVLFCALEGLHFTKFLDEEVPLPEPLLEKMNTLAVNPSKEHLEAVETSAQYEEVMTKYEIYTTQTMEGSHGSTAKFWMIYIKLVSIYLRFSRACRTNNLALFVDALKDMCEIFFAMNRPNYARWMVRYYLNLVNIEHTHPGMSSKLERGALSIRRTDKHFSRTPVDMTLEQTINADAASRQSGIAAFTNSDSARRRWMITRSMRSSIVGGLLEKAGLKSADNVAGTLRQCRVAHDHDDVQKVRDKITTTLNPFNITPEEHLYCLTTGKQCSDETKKDLLGCIDLGKKWKDEFQSGCFSEPSRFEKPIPRRKIRNFATDAKKTKVTSKDKKIVELQGTRDLFGRLLYISTINNIDLRKVFQFPLVPVPLSLGHIDGSVNKTDKSVLMRKLEKMGSESHPSQVDVTFIDAAFFLHTLSCIPSTMGELSKLVLSLICKTSDVVHFVCDSYVIPSIKGIERQRRGENDAAHSVIGVNQKTPTNWQQALMSPSFKTSLFRFLASDWTSATYAELLHGHEVYIGFDDTCSYVTEENGNVVQEDKPQYCCSHEEADTRLIYHMNVCLQENNNNIHCVVRSNDTDVLVLLLHHISCIDVVDVWMDAGLSGKNTRRFINLNGIKDKIGTNLAMALPGYHAFTGCDYTAAFMNKGKIKPLEIMMKSDAFLDSFGCLGDAPSLAEDHFAVLEEFVCQLYGKPDTSDINEVRYALFKEKYAFSTTSPLGKIKGLNPCLMPPCQRVLREKINRANYVARIWKRARDKIPKDEFPEEHGWLLQNDTYAINWFNEEQLPDAIVDMLVTDALEGDEFASDQQEEWDSDASDDEDDDGGE